MLVSLTNLQWPPDPPSAWICTFNQISLLKLCGAPIALKPAGHLPPTHPPITPSKSLKLKDPDVPKQGPKGPKDRSPLSPVGPQLPAGHLTAPSSSSSPDGRGLNLNDPETWGGGGAQVPRPPVWCLKQGEPRTNPARAITPRTTTHSSPAGL